MPKGKDIATERVIARLEALRDQYGVTEAGIARATGYRQQKINDFFNRQIKFPALDFMDAIARVFHYTLADMLAQDLPPPTLTKGQLQFLVNLKTLKKPDQHLFEVMMEKAARKTK